MFEQSPVVGPGLGTVTEHTAEILVLLTGAFLLGHVFCWLLTRATRQQLRQALTELVRTRERLVAAERRPLPTARLRESNSTEHERTLTQLRESREAEVRAREKIIALEGEIALLENERDTASNSGAPTTAADAMLFDIPTDKPRKK